MTIFFHFHYDNLTLTYRVPTELVLQNYQSLLLGIDPS
jgi:hypothetical protein